MKRAAWLLVAGAVVALGGCLAHDARQVDEAEVRAFYDRQAQSWNDRDGAAICALYAEDFLGHAREVGPQGESQPVEVAKAQVCTNLADLVATRAAIERRGGVMVLAERIDEVTIAPDGRSAVVRATTHIDEGGGYAFDVECSDRLALRLGRLQFVGGEARTRILRTLAPGASS